MHIAAQTLDDLDSFEDMSSYNIGVRPPFRLDQSFLIQKSWKISQQLISAYIFIVLAR